MSMDFIKHFERAGVMANVPEPLGDAEVQKILEDVENQERKWGEEREADC